VTTTEHTEAVDEYRQNRDIQVVSAMASVEYTKAHAGMAKARGHLLDAIASTLTCGVVMGLAWSIWWWCR